MVHFLALLAAMATRDLKLARAAYEANDLELSLQAHTAKVAATSPENHAGCVPLSPLLSVQ